MSIKISRFLFIDSIFNTCRLQIKKIKRHIAEVSKYRSPRLICFPTVFWYGKILNINTKNNKYETNKISDCKRAKRYKIERRF